MIVNDKVYDLTDFIDYHPAGHEIMLEYAGTDATNAFNEKPHTLDAADMLEKYLIGELVLEDRMFTWFGPDNSMLKDTNHMTSFVLTHQWQYQTKSTDLFDIFKSFERDALVMSYFFQSYLYFICNN